MVSTKYIMALFLKWFTKDTYIITAIRRDFTGVSIKALKHILLKLSQLCIKYTKNFIATAEDILYIKCQ